VAPTWAIPYPKLPPLGPFAATIELQLWLDTEYDVNLAEYPVTQVKTVELGQADVTPELLNVNATVIGLVVGWLFQEKQSP
jgi:hypothetical protein